MVKGNVIEFGYGDVVVGVDPVKGCITIANIKPPLECGTTIKRGDNSLEYGTTVEIYENEIHDIYNLICTVNEENRVVKYNNWIFDFSNYNEESVRVVREKAFHIVDVRCLAC